MATENITGSSTGVSKGDNRGLDVLYPDAISPVYPDVIDDVPGVVPFQHQYSQRVLVSDFANGAEVRRLSWIAPRRDVIINYHYITRTESQRIYNFYQEREGPLNSFAFFFPNDNTYSKEYCGAYLGDSNYKINLPSKRSQGSYSLYRGNTVLNASQYTFSAASGPYGEDTAILHFTPNTGDRFYFSFIGRLKIKARFSESPIQVNEIKDRWASCTVELIGLEAKFI